MSGGGALYRRVSTQRSGGCKLSGSTTAERMRGVCRVLREVTIARPQSRPSTDNHAEA